MELILPTRLNASEPTVLETKVLVVIGANGAGKSSFGRDLQERYAENAKRYQECIRCSYAATKSRFRRKATNWPACSR